MKSFFALNRQVGTFETILNILRIGNRWEMSSVLVKTDILSNDMAYSCTLFIFKGEVREQLRFDGNKGDMVNVSVSLNFRYISTCIRVRSNESGGGEVDEFIDIISFYSVQLNSRQQCGGILNWLGSRATNDFAKLVKVPFGK